MLEYTYKEDKLGIRNEIMELNLEIFKVNECKI